MFSRLTTISLYAVAACSVFAVATPWDTTTPVTKTVTVTATAPATTVTEPATQCNTGPVQCCDSVESAMTTLLGLLGIVLTDLDILVGLTCSPISAVGIGSGATCNAEPVCCENNNFSGLISLGCSPVNLNL
ncbi:fungal hydrophobin [Leucogyrophana mollusca]|uniref:Fungal hydrophobin n=1 Tax=Leucogyrophana mollusca TaxID=85980 RepID=A0ACB8BR47_9AGAM|nr:fungal hydrophobin [Leucogyrophana mollusca]